MVYTVSEMAKILGVTPSTLRYYDREGLLPFVERSTGGMRVFTENDYRWLKIITCLKQTGMHLKDIRTYIHMAMEGDKTIDDRLKMFFEQRENIKRQMENLQQTLEIVEYKCWYYEVAKENGTTQVPGDMPEEDLPERFRAVRKKLRESH